MGTSSSYNGPGDKNQLLPYDYDEDSNENDLNTKDESKQEPWKNAKKLMSQYISGSNRNLRGVLKGYVKATGGAHRATNSSVAGMRTASSLGQFLSSIRQEGFIKTFKELEIEFEGREVAEVLSELVNIISFSSNTKEDIVAKDALIETLGEVYEFIEMNNMDISRIESIDSDMYDNLMCTYISSYIWGKILNDLGSRFEKYSSNINEAIEMEKEFKDYIKNTVEIEYDKKKSEFNDSSNHINYSINNVVRDLYLSCFEVLEGVI